MIVAETDVVKTVARSLRRSCGVMSGAAIVVAVSGGADSVALLRMLAHLATRRRFGYRLAVGHVQHHLRDDLDAEADATFVAAVSESLGLPYYRRDVHPGSETGNIESNARRLRYAALADIAGEANAKFVAAGHHADDQLETMLMRLARGAAVGAMAGMRWRRRISPMSDVLLIRPMLGVERHAARVLLTSIGQTWREDITNDDRSRARANLRSTAVPALRAVNPAAAMHAVALSEHLCDVAAMVNAATDAAWAAGVRTSDAGAGAVTIDRVTARSWPAPVIEAVLYRAAMQVNAGGDRVGRSTLHRLAGAIKDHVGGTRRFALRGGAVAMIDRHHCVFSPAEI